MQTEYSAPDVIDRAEHGADSTDYYAFYQSAGRWKWQCVSAEGEVVVSCDEGFRQYLDCVADAAKHGWAGQPLMFLSAVEPSNLP
jgi:hypothetical protein